MTAPPRPIGAVRQPDGRTRFRLWAPAARTVELVLDGRTLPMQAEAGGYHALELDCPVGSRYRFRIDRDQQVPDPASRAQADDVHGDSLVVDRSAYRWRVPDWTGRPWTGMVVMELHVGCCGGFDGVAAQLPRLAALGITAIELMPVADFSGRRNWGYDGVLPFAPAGAYGSPEQLKSLVDRAHELGMCIHLDVVYNHFGPEGNYLPHYAPQFFVPDSHSPWGAAIDFRARPVRDFFTANALYWLHEFRFDGLRFDAVHAIEPAAWLDEMAAIVRASIEPGRHVHLVLENERNAVGHLDRGFDAQWNDDCHNTLHVLLTGEHEGYYADYRHDPLDQLARCLGEGFVYQGQRTTRGHRRPRGEPSAGLPPHCFVLFLQNHDQIGNRAFGERLIELADERALRAAIVLQLLSPQIPLLFMGEEFGCRQPFLYFTDFHDALADAVRDGRRREFAAFAEFEDPRVRESIPDPNDEATFRRSCPDFAAAADPANARWVTLYRDLLAIRRERIAAALGECRSGGVERVGERALLARWQLGPRELAIAVNLAGESCAVTSCSGELLYESAEGGWSQAQECRLPAFSSVAFLRG